MKHYQNLDPLPSPYLTGGNRAASLCCSGIKGVQICLPPCASQDGASGARIEALLGQDLKFLYKLENAKHTVDLERLSIFSDLPGVLVFDKERVSCCVD